MAASRSLFWMEPHVMVQSSFDGLQRARQVCVPGACHLVPSQPSSSCPLLLSSSKTPAKSRLRAGEKSWGGARLLLATILGCSLPYPLALPHQLRSVAVTHVSPATDEVMASFGFHVNVPTRRVVCHMIMCLAVTKAAYHRTRQR